MRSTTRARAVVGFATAVGLLAVAGCTSSQGDATRNDQATTESQLQTYQQNQPIQRYKWSQYRQTIIDVERAQVTGVATTTFFFNQGVQDPFQVCPSIGEPVPSTAQLTNPDQITWGANSAGSAVISQAEPNGVYIGDSSGTYVVCVAGSGKRYVDYWEGFVHTVGGAAHWDADKHQIVLDSPSLISGTKPAGLR
jgi:hypothetical protein